MKDEKVAGEDQEPRMADKIRSRVGKIIQGEESLEVGVNRR